MGESREVKHTHESLMCLTILEDAMYDPIKDTDFIAKDVNSVAIWGVISPLLRAFIQWDNMTSKGYVVLSMGGYQKGHEISHDMVTSFVDCFREIMAPENIKSELTQILENPINK